MWTIDLKSSSHDKLSSALAPLPSQLRPSTQAVLSSPQSVPDFALGCHQTTPPPKKRSRHWSLTETSDSICDTSVAASRAEIIGVGGSFVFGSLPSQNVSLQKLDCASVASDLCSAVKYASVEKYKSISFGQNLSSSATESLPSPSTPFADEAEDAELTVFPQEFDKLESYTSSTKSDNESHEFFGQKNFSRCSVILDSNSYQTPQQQPMHQKSFQHQKSSSALEHQKSQQPQDQSLRLSQFQHSSSSALSAAGMLGLLLSQQKELRSASDTQPSYISRQNLLLPLCTLQSSEYCSDTKLDAQPKNNNSYFQKWREPEKSKEGVGAAFPGSSHPPASSTFLEECSSPILKLHLSDRKQLNCKDQESSLTRFGTMSDTRPTTVSSASLKSPSVCPLLHTKTTLTSLLSEGKIASLLRNDDTHNNKFICNVSKTSQSMQGTSSKIEETKNFNKNTLSDVETVSCRFKEQSCSTMKLPPGSINSGVLINSDAVKPVESGSSALRPASTSHVQTFSEGKLKKKWAERMLVETKLEDNISHNQTGMEERPQEAVLRTTSLDFTQNACTDTGHRNMQEKDHGLEFSILRNLIDCKTVSTGNCRQVKELKLFKDLESASPSTQQMLILSNPLGSLKAMPCQTYNPSSFNVSSHPKLMLQLSQNQQNLRPDPLRSQTSLDDVKIKLEQDWTRPHQNKHISSLGQQYKVDGLSKKSKARYSNSNNNIAAFQGRRDKNALNKISVSEKNFVNHTIEQLSKKNISGEHQLIKTECSRFKESVPCHESAPAAIMVSDKTQEFGSVLAGLKAKSCDGVTKNEDKLDYSMTASSLVEKVIREVSGSSPQRGGCILYRKLSQVTTDDGHTTPRNVNHTPVSTDFLPNEETEYQMSSAAIESCDHTSITDNIRIQPVRKSRRANRGQKYQELIKEGVIQPSRERLATRNAERHGKNLESREEFHKVEAKRNLKHSASERVVPSERPAVLDNIACSSAAACSVEKTFTFRNLDQEKEIKSLSTCSLDQAHKKKMPRRHRDSETVVMASRHRRSSFDVTSSLSQSSREVCYATVSPSGCLAPTFEVEIIGSGCPMPHIPLPKKDKPTEPVTGSRKRKARKHCITRISVLEEEHSIGKDAVKKFSSSRLSPVPRKKPCSLVAGVLSVSGSCNKKESPRVLLSATTKMKSGDKKADLKSTSYFRPDGVSKNGISAFSVERDLILGRSDGGSSLISCCDTVLPESIGAGLASAAESLLSLNKISASQPHLTVSSGIVSKERNYPSSSSTITSMLSSTVSSQHSHDHSKVEATDFPEISFAASINQGRAVSNVSDHTGQSSVRTAVSRPNNMSSNLSLSTKVSKPGAVPKKLVKLLMPGKETNKPRDSSKEEPPKKKQSKSQAKSKSKLEVSLVGETQQAALNKAHGAMRRKIVQGKKVPVVSGISNAPVASSLLGH